MLNLDLNDPTNQVRALVGDLESGFISDTNILFLLNKNNQNVAKSAIEALDYILSMVAFYTREEAGDVKVYWNDIYNQLSKRKEQLVKENAYAITGSLFKFGGTTKSEISRVKSDLESEGVGVRVSDFSTFLESYGIDPEDPFYLKSL